MIENLYFETSNPNILIHFVKGMGARLIQVPDYPLHFVESENIHPDTLEEVTKLADQRRLKADTTRIAVVKEDL